MVILAKWLIADYITKLEFKEDLVKLVIFIDVFILVTIKLFEK
jgi:hypothetical protein